MSHRDLLSEVTRAVSPRVTADEPLVLTCIEYLIDKEYIARHETQQHRYVYVP